MTMRVGIIGGGVYGSQLTRVFSTASKMGDIDLVAIADIKPGVLEEMNKTYGLKGYLDYKEMFEKERLDAVAIVTPDYLHKEIAINAADAKLHMIVQKPLDTTSEGAREMIEAAERNGVMLYADFHKRFDPGHIKMRNDIRSGKIGEVLYGYACMEDQIIVPSVWFKNWAQHSSPGWFLGVHFYDLIYWLIGTAPKEVYSTGIKKKLISMGIDTYDAIQSKFIYENGSCITVDSSWILPMSFCSVVNQQIRLVGTEGIIEMDSQDKGYLSAFESDSTLTVPNPYGKYAVEMPGVGEITKGYMADSMMYFIEMLKLLEAGAKISDIKNYYPNGEEAIISTKMAEAVHESARTGKRVKIC